MPDPASNQTAAAAAPTAATPPPVATPSAAAAPAGVKIKFNGVERVLDNAEAARLAQIALHDEARRGRLATLEAEMKAKAPLMRVAEELGQLASSNPSAARALIAANQALRAGTATPEQILSALSGQGASQLQEGSPQPNTNGSADPQTRAALADLQAQLRNVAEDLQGQRAERTARDTSGQVHAALSSDPFLSTRPQALRKAHDDAMLLISQGRSMDEAIPLAAQGIQSLLSETATAQRDHRLEGNEMRTVPATAGMPATRDFLPTKLDRSKATSPDAFMKGAWKETREKVRDYARAVQRAAVQGPNG